MNQTTQSNWKPAILYHYRLALVLLSVLLGVGAAAGASNSTDTISQSLTGNASEKSPWQRIVLIGASATAGFTLTEPLGGSNTALLRLSRYVEGALTVAHEPVQNFGNAYLFLQPDLFAGQQLAQALTNQPTLTVGVDFLFWFCYGEGTTDEERMARFDKGLKLLEKIKGPLVVGDIPDASAAVNKMIRPDQMPSLNAIAAANRKLKEWAASRPEVTVLALSEFMRNAMANQAIKIRDHIIPNGKTRLLLQADNLHPSPPGCAVLALAVLDAVRSKRAQQGDEFYRDPNEIFRRGFKSPETTSASAAGKPTVPNHE